MAFRFPFRRPKSNGVRVSRDAYRHIRAGDRARAAADWPAAAAAYRLALAEMSELAHIWMQYGHASKEAGDRDAATAAYARAAALSPEDHEPHMFLGHLARRGKNGAAARHYLDALRRKPDDLHATGEVMRQLLGSRRADRDTIDEALLLLGIDRADVVAQADEQATVAGTVFLDISDLLGFFGFSRVPSGVQRVQIEIVLALIDADRAPIALCCHSAPRHGWTIVTKRSFRAVCSASQRGDGADWERELRSIYVASVLAQTLAFPADAILVSFSAGSPAPDYLLDVRTATSRAGLVHVPLMYDLIPILFPDLLLGNNRRSFAAWIGSLTPTMRGFIAISDATRRDLLDHAARAGHPIAPSRSRVLRLDGDTRKPGAEGRSIERLSSWRLKQGGYVLFVSTIEPRKNHVGAFAAWLRLARELGERAMPDLVCVGGKGWLNDEVHAMLRREPVLRRKVRLLHGLDDDDLDLLYRGCAFTLYPSFYEGWGLPVTESLCHGKLPVVSRTSSMPEAGGRFAIYLDPQSVDSIVDTVRPLILDPGAIAAREAIIRDGFRPRSWLAIGDELMAEASAIAAAAREEGERIPAAPLGIPIALTSADRIADGGVDGEVFRLGTGWGSPDDHGCPIEGGDALLRFALPAGGAAIRLDLRAEDAPVRYRLHAAGTTRGALSAGERRGVTIMLPARRVAEIAIDVDGDGGLLVEGFAILAAVATA